MKYFATQKDALEFALRSLKSDHSADAVMNAAKVAKRTLPGIRPETGVSAPSLAGRALGSTTWSIVDGDLPRLKALLADLATEAVAPTSPTPSGRRSKAA